MADDLTRQSSAGSDETNDYPEGLPGTTPPDDNRFMKRMKALDRKAGHGKKASPNACPNDSKRRETREGSSAYLQGHVSPIRELDIVEQFPTMEKRGSVEETGGGIDSEKTCNTPSRGGGSEKAAVRKHTSVSAWVGSTEEGSGDKTSASRRSTLPTGVPRSRSKKDKWKSKVTRDSHREVKRRPFEADADGDGSAVDGPKLEVVPAEGEDTVKKLSKSESTGELAPLSSGDDADVEVGPMPAEETARRKQTQYAKTRRSTVTVPHHHTHLALQEIEQKRGRGGHPPREGGIAKEKKDFYANLKLAIVGYGIGALAKKRRQVPLTSHSRQYNRHASEGSIHGHPMSEQLWVHLNSYLEGSLPCENASQYQAQLLGRRLEVCRLLSKIHSFQLPLLEQQDSIYEFGGDGASGTGEYTEIPSSDEPTPHMSLEVTHEGVISREGDSPAEGRSPSSSSTQVEEATDHHRPIPHLSINDDPTSSLTPSAIQRLQLSRSSKPSSLDEPTPSFTPQSFLEKRQIHALQRVTSLLEKLEQAERLYPSTRALGDENPEYRRPNFCRKVEALQLWCKITEGLSRRLCDLSTWFGTRISNPKDDDLLSMERAFSSDSGTPSSSSVAYTPPVQSCAVLPSSLALSPAGAEERRHVGGMSPANSGKLTTRVVRVGRYHRFVVLALKKGIKRMMDSISAHNDCVLHLSLFALAGERSHGRWTEDDEGEGEERIPIYPSRSSSSGGGGEGQRVNWLAEFDKVNLPMFHDQFLLLARVRLDVIHECLRLQLYLRPPKTPSEFSISRLVTECRDTLEWALKVREEFAEMIEQAVRGNVLQGGHLDSVCNSFESDLTEVFDLYLDYLQDWVKMSAAYNVLSTEWPTVKALSRKMQGREAKAARRFCLMATQMLWQSNEFVLQNTDLLVEQLNAVEIASDFSAKRQMVEMSRLFKNLFTDSKENSSKVLSFAKALLKDLEVAADLHVDMSHKELLQSLHASDHAQVAITGRMDRGKMMFVPLQLARALDDKEGISELLTLAFGRDDFLDRFPQLSPIRDHLYILIVDVDHDAPQVVWPGEVIHVETSIEAIITSMELEVEGMKLVVWNSSLLDRCRRSVHKALGRVKDREVHTSSHQEVTRCLKDIREGAVTLCRTNLELYDEVQRHWDIVWELPESEESDTSAYHSMILACFNFGFENVRETIRLLGDSLAYKELGRCFLNYAIKWMDFIIQKCRKGRGTRPRWASSGLDFLMIGCHPRVLAALSREQFEDTKRKVNQCLSHVVGENPQRPPPRKQRGHTHFPFTAHGSPTLPRLRRIEGDMLGLSAPTRSLSDRPLAEEGEVDWCFEGLGGSTGSLRHPLPQLEEEYTSNFPPLGGVTSKTPPSTDSSASTSSGVVKDSPPESSGYDDTALFMSLLPPDLPYPSVPVTLTQPHSPDVSTSDAPDGICRIERIRRAAVECDQKRDCKLKENSVIGQTRERGTCAADAMRLSTLKQVEFTWIRGRLLGKGSSGKVYEAMNVKTGETMAVKQIPIQENNQRVVQRIIDEIANLQKLKHPNIIRYYGVEVHRSELFLFMEYCPEGNVWSLAQQGLHEALVRRYTCQMLHGLNVIHEHGIVHRDIKGANVFIASNGQLKLGDFGLSFQLRNASRSVMDEIADNVGTVPYMAPEVIRSGKTHHIGRASDIWSVGCTVIEMITGKTPWSELDNNMRIMFAVGSGSAPQIPDNISEEGREFLKFCFEIEPSKRWTASQLLNHAFVKVSQSDLAES